jgi:quinol monooxygenase YgiN
VDAMTYGLFSAVMARPGKRDELARYLRQAAQLLESDPSCLQYIVATSDEPDVVYVFEAWTDQGAHDASLTRDDIRMLVKEAEPSIAGMSDQTRLAIHGGKGLSD